MLPVLVLFIGLLFPLLSHSQEIEETEKDFADTFDEETLLMEDPEGITVTASPQTTQQMRVITKEEIARAHAPDLATLLQETLGLGITRYGPYGNQASISLRGFDADRITFLIDGIPANSPVTGELELSMIDLNAVERIQVIYGGSDSKYNVSGSLGGIVNIITVKKQNPGLRVAGTVSNTSTLPGQYRERSGAVAQPVWEDLLDTQNTAFSLGLGLEKLSIGINTFANRAENHFLFTDNNGKIRRKDNNEVWDTGTSISFVWDLPDYTKLIAGGDFYYGDKNIPTSGFSSEAKKQRDFSTRQNLMLDMPRIFRDDLSTEASLTHVWQTLDYGSASHHAHRVITAINRWGWYPRSWFTLRAGGDYRFITLDSTDMQSRDQRDGGLYLTAEVKPAEKLLIIPSVKAVFNSNGASPVVAIPKLGFAWFAAEDLTVRNNYFRSFKYPDFEDLYWPDQGSVVGNPDLKPEDGWGADLGASYRYQIISLDSTFFTQYTNDSIHWAPGAGGVWRPSNVGAAVFFGLDAKVSVAIPLPKGPFTRIIPSLTYQGMLSYLLSYGYDFASKKRIPYMPAHTLGFSIDLPWKTGALLMSGYFASERYANTANTTVLAPHLLLNVNVNQKIGDTFTAFGEIRNLLNSSYESFDDYPMPGITLTVGIRMQFEGIGSSADERE
jgi:vitamin B12 transporter